MLPRSLRLNRAAFDLVRRSRHVVSNSSLSLRFVCRADRATWHFSVVVPGAFNTSAVERNKCRRRIYDIVQKSPAVRGIDGILYVRKGQDLSSSRLQQAVSELLTQSAKRCSLHQ